MAAILVAAQKRDGRFSYRCTLANNSSAKAQPDSIDTGSLRAPVRQCVGNRFGRRKKSANRIGLSDSKKRIGRGLYIGRLRHSRPKTNLAALKKRIAPLLGRGGEWVSAPESLQQIGRAVRCRPYAAPTVEMPSTDTASDVSVAFSQERHWSATVSATDPLPIWRQNPDFLVKNRHDGPPGGGGQPNPFTEITISMSFHRNFIAIALIEKFIAPNTKKSAPIDEL